mmetsp:Transcript_44263/g.137859  ORF Transcript_44263/g.137859 Transcript_44263/m.137859 type:complete len:282 (-) Transcript_44263:293-1138(-)
MDAGVGNGTHMHWHLRLHAHSRASLRRSLTADRSGAVHAHSSAPMTSHTVCISAGQRRGTLKAAGSVAPEYSMDTCTSAFRSEPQKWMQAKFSRIHLGNISGGNSPTSSGSPPSTCLRKRTPPSSVTWIHATRDDAPWTVGSAWVCMVGPSHGCWMKQRPVKGAKLTDIETPTSGEETASMPTQAPSPTDPVETIFMPTTSGCPRRAPVASATPACSGTAGDGPAGSLARAQGRALTLLKQVWQIFGVQDFGTKRVRRSSLSSAIMIFPLTPLSRSRCTAS